ncbi:MAG: cell surface protein, partial [Ottowia sp.]|nr:cell surface protein [Ottowia sp.]
MKKSILSLSAAVALGGLGFAGAANAIAVFDTDGAAGGPVVLHPAGTGHQLFTPYYTAQGNMATLINIVNTDAVNGKAVKVRFRGASNSDDVLDFTLFLSPGDVWSGMVS